MTNDAARTPSVDLQVLHENEHWFVLEKPARIHTVSQARGSDDSVEAWLRVHRAELGALEECGLVHRLDFETSGCLLVAKDAATRTRLRDALSGRGGDVRKIYLALAEGSCNAGSFELAFSRRHKGSAKVTVTEPLDADGKEQLGRCRWSVENRAEGSSVDTTLLRVELLGAGRRHQIRAGLAHRGMPLVGDTLYGAAAHAAGVHLHAASIEIDRICIDAPLPRWFG
ncbi:MAG: RNA pseudouridine synthase [Phycisphaerales bacterium]|nr:RNA pseudouridine synthase [Phycisphaerales bacterium]